MSDTRMKRKTYNIDDETEQRIRDRARRLKISESAALRLLAAAAEQIDLLPTPTVSETAPAASPER